MKESAFQSEVIHEIEERLPGSVVTKMEPNIQGIPDLLILYKKKWAMLECKKSEAAHHQPNQDYYVNMLNNMSYASFIYPENRKDVLDELERTLQPTRNSRIPKSKSV